MKMTVPNYPPGRQKVRVDTSLTDLFYHLFYLLKRDGGVIIKNYVDQATIEQAYKEVLPRLEADKPWSAVSKPQVSACTAFQVGSGAKNQQIHRIDFYDDYTFHNAHSEISSWNDEGDLNGCESAVGVFIAGVKTTKANGATRFIPGSHLWGNERKPSEEGLFYAELYPGDAFVMLASCYHGGSASSTTDEWRLVYATRGWLRQEENQFLTIPKDVIHSLDRKTQALLGWGLSDPMMGWVNFEDPMKLLHPDDYEDGPADLY